MFRNTWLLSGWLLAGWPGLAQAQQPAGTTALVVPYSTLPPVGGSRALNTAAPYERGAILLMRNEIRGVLPNTSLVSLGIDANNPPWPVQAAVTGNLRVWLRNSTDARYHLNDTWSLLLSQQPTPFQQVYNGPLTINPSGPSDISFQVPFTYTGGSLYVAYEWENPTPSMYGMQFLSSAGAAYNPWWHGSTGTSGFPAQLRDSSLVRPRLRLGYPSPARDAAIVWAEGIGELPVQSSGVLPYPVKVLVRNQGSQPLLNLPVSLVPGINAAPGSGTTTVLPSLAPGAEAYVRLPGLVPQAVGGFTYYTVQLPPDQNPTNDVWADSTVATTHEISYVRGFPFAVNVYLLFTQGIGGGMVGGTMLTRFPLHAPAQVSSLRLFLSHDRRSVGETVYGVVLDEAGHLLGRSANHVITAADQDNWLLCSLPTPVPVTGRSFFVGLAQLPHPAGGLFPPSHDPLTYQLEEFPRDSTCYIAVGDSAIRGLKYPRHVPQSRMRFMIEASLQAAPLAIRAAAPWLELWPNPAREAVQLRLPAGTGAARATLLDATGRAVKAEVSLRVAANQATFLLPDLPPGLYVLRVSTAGWQLSKRIMVE
ncbi:T9SS type A sorting domain-containing protein [Hymenobacter saemangeumensis]|uniref:T9SS type A sorting domain-containing protein n=1 Tax=Hymenobacter saemangeumensis TaxID=1084522 RepID=UPI0031ECA394